MDAAVYGGVVFAAGCLVMTVYVEIQACGSYQLASQLPDAPITEDLRNGALQLAFVGLVPVFPAVVSVDHVRASFRSRERLRRRLRAIRGEQEAMPRARVLVDANDAPHLAGESLKLLWRATPLTSRVMTTLIVIFLMVFGPFVALFWYLAYCLVTNTPPMGGLYLEPVPLADRVLYAAVAGFVAALLLYLVVFLIRILPWERGRPYGVTASDEGLWYYPRMGKRCLLRWDGMCLLEVKLSKNGPYRKFTLYGQRTLAEWFDVPPSKWVSLDMTKEEFEQRHQALLDLIAARTGLLPRTFDEKLRDGSNA